MGAGNGYFDFSFILLHLRIGFLYKVGKVLVMVCFIFSYYIFMHSSIAFFCFQFYKKKYQPVLYIILAVGLIALFMVFFI
ncbi:hypothetical protein DR980_13430 [Flavobacterium psychrolimnae]|uniref:Uncharacterized protein n=1 Tax=Flavobacterium psychrolimnae TaxID=249351 RepID=A0A366AX39_9FLAO|nr:hypothetical protein DR980_13430 [Flavobacterium psychrolimnae]